MAILEKRFASIILCRHNLESSFTYFFSNRRSYCHIFSHNGAPNSCKLKFITRIQWNPFTQVQSLTEFHRFVSQKSSVPLGMRYKQEFERRILYCKTIFSSDERLGKLRQLSLRSDQGVKARKSKQTVKETCEKWRELFEHHHIPEAKASVEYIVAFVLGKKTLYGIDRAREINLQQLQIVEKMCKQRLEHVPVQYILGEWDFGDIELKQRPPVFIPRPETEELAALTASCIEERNLQSGVILEPCCGSGAITLQLLHKFPLMSAVAVDISQDACELTLENAERLGMSERIKVLHGNICREKCIEQIQDLSPFDVLVSNPPYIPTREIAALEQQITHYEDIRALDGGHDGLDLVRVILTLCSGSSIVQQTGDVWLEVDPSHPELIQDLVTKTPSLGLIFVASHKDFLGRERFCHLRTVTSPSPC